MTWISSTFGYNELFFPSVACWEKRLLGGAKRRLYVRWGHKRFLFAVLFKQTKKYASCGKRHRHVKKVDSNPSSHNGVSVLEWGSFSSASPLSISSQSHAALNCKIAICKTRVLNSSSRAGQSWVRHEIINAPISTCFFLWANAHHSLKKSRLITRKRPRGANNAPKGCQYYAPQLRSWNA